MGKMNNVVNYYFTDNRRFADLFNAIYFRGSNVVDWKDLSETSETYHEAESENVRTLTRGKRQERIRDVCKTLRSGSVLRILALENQELVDYSLPFRCMQYDSMEYGKQLNVIRKRNRLEKRLHTPAEKLCGLQRSDRLVPIYTVCLYHGAESWNGPRSLRDMMDFGVNESEFEQNFSDYSLHLYCVNEAEDLENFQTEVKLFFKALKYRKDWVGLKKLMQQDTGYRAVDADTLEVISVVLELPSIWRDRKKYMSKNQEEKEEYDMCQAVKEWAEEERGIGREEGIVKGRMLGEEEKTLIIVKNMLKRGMSDEDILAIAECSQEFLKQVKKSLA